MTEQKLKPLKRCPFCGDNALIYEKYDYGSHVWYYVECLNCYCRTDTFSKRIEAIEAWNKRVGSEVAE